ncbi:SUMF1/EgtB/PvdO family nonheme iron enzyme [Terasakiella sp. A23]|uniref:formylglycine-generating enzyme family protein n=1 Tax=Terasakiella sp. FCG-A23 TaxID=3080561 RepID=UPI002955C49B|nr:SUMF1/EgtB/PvdO family nonheme iron enzyme [Terasakiella sp. A23]MDV7339923.1 SUMF1/EgtB/PvdO family nonheme iron enzyme [Terasakiella sp. A23]
MKFFGLVFLAFLLSFSKGHSKDLSPGTVFRDCPDCPEMVVIPSGSFMMGAEENEDTKRDAAKGSYYIYKSEHSVAPVHKVTIAKSFAMARFELTIEDWEKCYAAGVCYFGGSQPRYLREKWAIGKGSGRYPQQGQSLEMANMYVQWLSEKTGHTYRIPTSAEWEFAARAGTTTPYWWGTEPDYDKAVTAYDLYIKFLFWRLDKERIPRLRVVGTRAPNPFGLYDMLGNLAEWTQDCDHDSYEGAPSDGSAWFEGNCDRRVLRGAHYLTDLKSFTFVSAIDTQNFDVGLSTTGIRLVRELE